MDKVKSDSVDLSISQPLIVLFFSAHVIAIYDFLGIHSPNFNDLLSGFYYTLFFMVIGLPGAGFLAVLYNWFSLHGFKFCFFRIFRFHLYLSSFGIVFFVVYMVIFSDDLVHLFDDPVVYSIETSDLGASDINVLKNRLIEILPSRYSSVSIDPEKENITFYRGAPEESLVSLVSENPGFFSMGGESHSEPWVSNEHLSRVAPTEGYNGEDQLNIVFDREGAERLYEHTNDYNGEVVLTKVDGVIISSGKLRGPLGASISVSIDGIYRSKDYAILLNSGVLTKPITLKIN